MTENNNIPNVLMKTIRKPRKVQFDFSIEVLREKWECCKCSTMNDFGIENDFNDNLLPEWCRYTSCWHGRCGLCYYVGETSPRHCNGMASRMLKSKIGNEEAYMLPLKTQPIEVETSATSDGTGPFYQSPKAAVEVAELCPPAATGAEAWLPGETPITYVETTKIDNGMSPRRPAPPRENPKTEAKDKKKQETTRLQKKKQNPSSENIFVALAKSAFPSITLKSSAKSIKTDKTTQPVAETKHLTKGEEALEKILSALEKSKEREEVRKKDKGKDRA